MASLAIAPSVARATTRVRASARRGECIHRAVRDDALEARARVDDGDGVFARARRWGARCDDVGYPR